MEGAGLPVGNDSLRRGDYCDAEALENLGHIFDAGVDAKTGLGNSAEAADCSFLVGAVLKGNTDDALCAFINYLISLDVALVEEDLGDSLAFLILVSISAIGSVVCISAFLLLYQLALRTPGICPL